MGFFKKKEVTQETVERKLYPNYHKLCPKPEKNKKSFPYFWEKLNKYEKVKWCEENLIGFNNEIKDSET